jgi:hypothetical protein
MPEKVNFVAGDSKNNAPIQAAAIPVKRTKLQVKSAKRNNLLRRVFSAVADVLTIISFSIGKIVPSITYSVIVITAIIGFFGFFAARIISLFEKKAKIKKRRWCTRSDKARLN